MESTSTNQILLHKFSQKFPRWFYRVFVCFRGEDTRQNIVGHLFTALSRIGLDAFREADDFRKGEDISTELMKAIDESMISIIVFSKTFASSRWCLEEVVKIVQCKERGKLKVLPVFFGVDPSEVRHQTGRFDHDLTRLQQKFGAKKVTKWKENLTKVADFSGLNVQTDAGGFEAVLIDQILVYVQRKVNLAYSKFAEHPVGIHACVIEIRALFYSKANNDDVQMIVIYGKKGIGKTTLAKAIYKKICRTFDGGCIFYARSAECLNVQGSERLKHILKQLLFETLTKKEVDQVDEGMRLIKKVPRCKKLLIVVDDVDHESQLKALVREEESVFGPGSTIIITSRDRRLLVGRKNCTRYEVNELGFEDSLQLFSWHAFGQPKPPEAFVNLSSMMVGYFGGLPEKLKYLGSHFNDRSSIQDWRDEFEKLKKVPHHDVSQWKETLRKDAKFSGDYSKKAAYEPLFRQQISASSSQQPPSHYSPYTEQAHRALASPASIIAHTDESLASTDQLSFVPKALGKRSCEFPASSPELTTEKIKLDFENESISGGRVDSHSFFNRVTPPADLRTPEGKSSDHLCDTGLSLSIEIMTVFHEIAKQHKVAQDELVVLREQAKTTHLLQEKVDVLTSSLQSLTDEIEKLKESHAVELAKAHSEANVAKAEAGITRSSVEAAKAAALKAWQGSKESLKAAVEYTQQRMADLVDKVVTSLGSDMSSFDLS